MVEVDDQAEWDFLLKFIDTHRGFNGCSNIYGNDHCAVFLNVTRQPMSFTIWGLGQPSGFRDCVAIAPAYRKMYNTYCFYSSETDRTVCELDVVA